MISRVDLKELINKREAADVVVNDRDDILATVSVPKMIYMYKLMSASEQSDFLTRIGELEE